MGEEEGVGKSGEGGTCKRVQHLAWERNKEMKAELEQEKTEGSKKKEGKKV